MQKARSLKLRGAAGEAEASAAPSRAAASESELSRRRGRTRPGVILLQIDGLPLSQFNRAVKAGRMPFLRSMLRRGSHALKTFYPGQPSCTPAVQAELMFGKRCAVPAFGFFDSARGEDYKMYSAEWARRIAEEAGEGAAPLLEGGSSYGNIYTGGAARAGYCGELNTPDHWMSELSLFKLGKLFLRFPFDGLRVLGLCAAEIALSFYDFFKGGLSRGEAFNELKFIGARVGVSIALREAIRYHVQTDARDGLPIIHANFFGYDEQAHRRGPHSAFAHWSLKGIDDTVRAICRTARRSGGRDYEIVVFSDHGQEAVMPFEQVSGQTLEAFTGKLFDSEDFAVLESGPFAAIAERAQFIFRRATGDAADEIGDSRRRIRVRCLGPVAHVYVDGSLTDEQKLDWARRYVATGMVPAALYLPASGDARCIRKDKEGDMEVMREELDARSHPFAQEVIEDLAFMVESRLSGDLVLLGWRAGAKPISFSSERGAHGGPGVEETQGFALLPKRIDIPKTWIRAVDLRNIAFRLSGRPDETRPVHFHAQVTLPATGVRIATYNVHGGVGADGRFDAHRIAHVVERIDADIVCFQEAFHSSDPARSLEAAIQKELGDQYAYHFMPLHERRGQQFGLAIASRLPFRVHKSKAFLMSEATGRLREPRGAIWAKFERDGETFDLVNTHLGLRSAERARQIDRLLSKDWLGGGDHRRRILVGDLNAGPTSEVLARLRKHFVDTQAGMEGPFAGATFLSWAPLRRIDYALISPDCRLERSSVYNSRLTRLASDHLPLYIDVEIDERKDANEVAR